MNKKFRLVLALVLALVMVFALTACTQHDCEKDGHKFVEGACKYCGEKESAGGGDLPDGLPVEDGKVTFYLTLTDIELASHNSIWLCGPMNYTEESTDFGATAAEMIRLGTTDVYYVQYDAAKVEAALVEGVTNAGQYQLALGYNASSGASADKQGVNWSFKFVQETTGLDNPSWAELYTAGSKAVNLGDVTFDSQPGAVVVLEKVTFTVTLDAALPEGWIVVMPGSHVDWDNDITKDAMTPSADRKVWSFEVEGILEGTYEYQILVEKADATAITWSHHTEGAPDGNETIAITGMDNNNEVALRGEPAVFDSAIFAAKETVTNVTIVVKLTEALPEGYSLYLPGTVTSWTPSAHPMTASADGLTWTFLIESIDAGDYECQAVAGSNAAEADAWTYKPKDANLTVTITTANANGEIVVLENATYNIAK